MWREGEVGVSDSPSIQTAFDLGEEGMARVARNAGRDFHEKAFAFILTYLQENRPTPGEDVTDACKDAGIVPHDDRAFGPVYMQLLRERAIESTGEKPRRKGHGAPGCRIWKATE